MRTICVIFSLLILSSFPAASFGDPNAVGEADHLIKNLNNGEYRVRIGALREIAQSGSPNAEPAIPIIRQILQTHGDPHMRAAAAKALQAIGPKGLPVLIETLNDQNTPGDNSAVIEAIASFGAEAKDAVPALAQIIEKPNYHQQRLALKALRQIGVRTPTLLSSALKMLETTNEYSPVFNEVAETLSHLATPEELVPLLEAQRPIIRTVAAKALGKMGPKAQVAVPALIARLDERKQPYKYAQALGGIGPPALPELVTVIEDPSSPRMQRIYAVMAIGEIGPGAKEAVPLLIDCLDDLELVNTAVEALGKLGGAASSAVPRLIELKDTADHRYLRNQAAEALVQIGTPEALLATALFRMKDKVFEALFGIMTVFLILPGLVFVVPLLLVGLYVATKKFAKRKWAYRPLLLPIVLWSLYAVYETAVYFFWSSGGPIRVDLLILTPILFAALAIGLAPWGLNLLLPASKQN